MPKNRIHKLKDGRYSYRFTAKSGKRKSLKSRKTENLKAFKLRCESEELKYGEEGSELTFGDIFELYYTSHVETLSLGRQQVIKSSYINHLMPALAHLALTEITPNMLFNLFKDMGAKGYSSGTLSNAKSITNAVFRFAKIQLQMSNINIPTQSVSIAKLSNKKPKPKRVISAEEEALIFKTFKNPDYQYYLRLLLLTGFRPSEGMGLKIKDLQDDGVHVQRAVPNVYDKRNLTKNDNAQRVFPWTLELRKLIDDRLQTLDDPSNPEVWLFSKTTNRPSLNPVTKAFAQKMRRLKLPMSLYCFRHTFATRGARVLPVKTLQYLMGHETVNLTLEYYVGIENCDLENAVKVLNDMQKG